MQGQYGAPGAYSPGPAAGGYEFTPEQDRRIASLGTKLIVAGVFQILWGLGQGTGGLLFGLAQWLYNAPIALALVVIGIMFIVAGVSFRKIRATQGNDVQHLMSALSVLSWAAVIQIAGFVFAMLAGLLVLLLVFVFAVISFVA